MGFPQPISSLQKKYVGSRDMRDEQEKRDRRNQSLHVVLVAPVSLGLPVAR
jgi:hypothetical protein